MNAERLYEALTCPKALKVFTVEEGGAAHCQMDRMPLAHYSMFNWLDEVLAVGSPG